jgi:hypothetical protein
MCADRRYLGVVAGLAVAFVLGLQGSADAGFLYSFAVFENADGADPADVKSNVFLDVSDASEDGVNRALFELSVELSAPASLSVTEIYVEDGTLLGIADLIQDEEDVFFQRYDEGNGLEPDEPPGSTNLDPIFTPNEEFSVDPRSMPYGIGPGETLGILYDLQPEVGFGDVIQSIEDGFDSLKVAAYLADPENADPTLRLAIRVQGLPDNDYSVTAILIPEPSSLAYLVSLLLGGGLLVGLCLLRCRRAAE